MKTNGYFGKVLWVNLGADKVFKPTRISDEIYRNYLGGYGLAARLIYDSQAPGVDPLGPDNILAVMTGMLTGTGAFFSGRYSIAAKSPLTGTWCDANSGGYFAPGLCRTGFDGILVRGASATPVYLYLDDKGPKLLDASDLWGLDSTETEDLLKTRHGSDCQSICIGQAGERRSLMAGVVNDKGRLAARGGLGAVMGSKHLKAICVNGTHRKEVYDSQAMSLATGAFLDDFGRYDNLKKDQTFTGLINLPFLSAPLRWLTEANNSLEDLKSVLPDIPLIQDGIQKLEDLNPVNQTPEIQRYAMHKWGTCAITSMSANSGDSPVKNWTGSGVKDFPGARATRISNDWVTRFEVKKYGCHHCPLRCGSILQVTDGEYPVQEVHKPEYETLCGFGTMVLADDVRAIIHINDLLNRAGLDTISTGVVVAWAFEAFEKGLITLEDTEGLELRWGDSNAVVELVRKICAGDGLGAILEQGVKKASEHFGENTRAFAMHVGGQELPMHDTRNKAGGLMLAVAYEAEPTPGRHTSFLPGASAPYRQQEAAAVKPFTHPLRSDPGEDPEGWAQADGSIFMDLINGLGLCAFGFGLGPVPPIVDWANNATGWDLDFDTYMTAGKRIKTLRQLFNVREGLIPSSITLPARAAGTPPLKHGPNKGYVPPIAEAKMAYYKAMGWDPFTGIPTPETIRDLGLE